MDNNRRNILIIVSLGLLPTFFYVRSQANIEKAAAGRDPLHIVTPFTATAVVVWFLSKVMKK